MPAPITEFQQFTYTLPGWPYRAEAYCVPPCLPATHRVRQRFDDRSIPLPKVLGSVWFEVWEPGGGLVAQATFAGGAATVQCDGIDVDADHRRKGIATAVYNIASSIFAAPVVPAAVQTADAKVFWNGRSQIP